MNKYFINIIFYVPKNKLEELLQAGFAELNHKIIPENRLLKEIDLRFTEIQSDYFMAKGRADVPFNCSNLLKDGIVYSIGNCTVINLTLIKGEI